MIIQRTKYFADKKEEKKKKDYTTDKSAAKIAGGSRLAGKGVGGLIYKNKKDDNTKD